MIKLNDKVFGFVEVDIETPKPQNPKTPKPLKNERKYRDII